MPQVLKGRRKAFIDGVSDVCPWQVEQTLVFGYPLLRDPCVAWRTVDRWHEEWAKWRDVIMPKVIEHRPGTRPVAMYVTGEIPRRELRMPLETPRRHKRIAVDLDDGTTAEHWLNVPMPWMDPEASWLHGLGIVSDDELQRHHAWVRSGRDDYALEMALYH